MFKSMKSLALIISGACLFVSCGTTGLTGITSSGSSTSSSSSSSTSSSTSSYVMDVLGSFLGNYTSFKKTDLYGTWNYVGTDCKFKSENLLKQAGGEVAAKEIETKLDDTFTKLGIKSGACSFIFNSDNTYSAVVGKQKLSGSYTFNEDNKLLTLTYLMGLGKLDANVTKSGSNISMLFDADKIMTLLNLVGGMSDNSTVKAVTALINEYDGVMLGFQLKK